LEINLIIKQEVNETAAEQERIKEFGKKSVQAKLTIIPKLFTNEKGMAKLNGLCRGKKTYDKESLKSKTPSVILPESKKF
jgi:tmRNA-binding protein